ncbi:MAG: Sua5/YciO/YrdC/YwlC family protein [Mariprofundales bacterium]
MPTIPISRRLRLRRVARQLRKGQLIAHVTGTLAGIASLPEPMAIRRMQLFKQRQGPFLLLAANQKLAVKQCVYLPLHLRHLMCKVWPGSSTLIYSAHNKKAVNMPAACRQKNNMAVRVDANIETRWLAACAGGWLVSSSLNRKQQTVQQPTKRLRFRWHRHITTCLPAQHQPDGQASKLLQVRATGITRLR